MKNEKPTAMLVHDVDVIRNIDRWTVSVLEAGRYVGTGRYVDTEAEARAILRRVQAHAADCPYQPGGEWFEAEYAADPCACLHCAACGQPLDEFGKCSGRCWEAR